MFSILSLKNSMSNFDSGMAILTFNWQVMYQELIYCTFNFFKFLKIGTYGKSTFILLWPQKKSYKILLTPCSIYKIPWRRCTCMSSSSRSAVGCLLMAPDQLHPAYTRPSVYHTESPRRICHFAAQHSGIASPAGHTVTDRNGCPQRTTAALLQWLYKYFIGNFWRKTLIKDKKNIKFAWHTVMQPIAILLYELWGKDRGRRNELIYMK